MNVVHRHTVPISPSLVCPLNVMYFINILLATLIRALSSTACTTSNANAVQSKYNGVFCFQNKYYASYKSMCNCIQ